ncbi:MAG: peptidoglycan-binding protein [Candidatus Phosphoribacter sp.]
MNLEPWDTVSLGDDLPMIIRGIQWLLRARGHVVATDGVFGPITRTAVQDFQTAQALPLTGDVDEVTWLRLVWPSGPGSAGDAVRAVQQFGLPRWVDDEPLAVDGNFGPKTEERVRHFQASWGLAQDGWAGRETWSFLQAFRPGHRLWPLVRPGATETTNRRVRAVQLLLRHHGSAIAADGMYGPLTGEAVRQWQLTQRALYISTTVGQLDWPGLIATCRNGDHGDHVRAVQSLLSGVIVDGHFGPITEAAVRSLQDVFLPPADGIVGPDTWHLLVVPLFD